MKHFLVLIAILAFLGCSEQDVEQQQELESDFYIVTLRLQGVIGASYNTSFGLNTFHETIAWVEGVRESQGEIQWEDGVIEHTFNVDAFTSNGRPLTKIVCGVGTTLHQEYDYAINQFIFTTTLKSSDGQIISELTSSEDISDGWLSFDSRFEIEF